MLTLHDTPISGNGYKARLLMAFLNIPYRYVSYDILKGETRTDEFLTKLNPNGRIPVLELEDGRILPESNAILCYLGESTPWVPNDAWQKAQMTSWLFWEQYSHEPNIATPRFWTHLPRLSPMQEAQLPGKMEAGRAALGLMQMQLGFTDWLVGDGPTLADIALYAYTHVAEEGGFDLTQYPGITAWTRRIEALDGYVPITYYPT